MVTLGSNHGYNHIVGITERIRAVSERLKVHATTVANRLFSAEQVYREISEAESRQRGNEMALMGWTVTFHDDGTALAENRQTGETLRLGVDDARALRGN